MPNTCRVLHLLIGLLVFLPTIAHANQTCEATKELRGNVKTVLISQGKVIAGTRTPLRPLYVWERVDLSPDRRTVTITQYSADGFSLLPLFNLWPATVCEFDQAGRLVRTRVKLNGLTAYTTVETTYDAQGRPVRERSRSRNPEFTYDATYEYSGNATTRVSRGVTITTITEQDAAGRPTRIVRRDSRENVELSSVEYRYGADTVEVIGRENGRSWRIAHKTDAHGNTVASETPYAHDSAQLEYDAHGNWVRRVGTTYWATAGSPRTSDLTVREISYWR
jgi:hypothetical protein